MEANLCRFFYCLFMHCPYRSSYQEVGIPLTDFIPPHVCAYPKPIPRFSTSYVIVLFCVQRVEVRGDKRRLLVLLLLVELYIITVFFYFFYYDSIFHDILLFISSSANYKNCFFIHTKYFAPFPF